MKKRCENCKWYEMVPHPNLADIDVERYGGCHAPVPMSVDEGFRYEIAGDTKAKHCEAYKRRNDE